MVAIFGGVYAQPGARNEQVYTWAFDELRGIDLYFV